MRFSPFSRGKGLYLLTTLIVLATAAILRLPSMWTLNRTALIVARWQVAEGLLPDWWLQARTLSSCLVFGDSSQVLPAEKARLIRLQGIVALACGDRKAASQLFRSLEERLSFDGTAPLLLEAATHSAREALPATVRSGASNWGVAVEKARDAFARGEREEAVAWLDSVQATLDESARPDRKNLYFSACFIYRRARRFESSLSACQKLVEIAPEDPEAWNLLGLLRLAVNDLDGAEKAFSKAIEQQDSVWATPYINLGRVFLARGDTEAARREVELALSLSPQEPWGHFYMATILVEQGDCQGARKHLRAALASNVSSVQQAAQQSLTTFTGVCGALEP